MTQEIKTIVIKARPMPFKHVLNKKCYWNISYKKALRLAGKKTKRNIVIIMDKIEKNGGVSRYKHYFQRADHLIFMSENPRKFCDEPWRTIKLVGIDDEKQNI